MIKSIDINKIVVSNKLPLGTLLPIKMLKKLDLYGYSFPKWMYVEET